jgi:hypothetical protein
MQNIDFVDRELVDRLFAEADAAAGNSAFRRNPIDGSGWVKGQDNPVSQKKRALRALAARRAFEYQRPFDVNPLPLSDSDREDLKGTGRAIDYVTSLFARSWAACNYGDEHPPFDRYVSGALASNLLPARVANDPDLVVRFGPAPLIGMGGGCIWRAPKRR